MHTHSVMMGMIYKFSLNNNEDKTSWLMLLPEEMQQLSTLNADTTVVQVSNPNKTNSMTTITKELRSLNNDTAQFPLAGQNSVVVRGDKFRIN